MARGEQVVVAGGGGFIGGWLVKHLLELGYRVRSVDVKPLDQWIQVSHEADNIQIDLKDLRNCRRAYDDAVRIYMLAADTGGLGYTDHSKSICMLGVLLSTHSLMVAQEVGVERFFYSSSASVYNQEKQRSHDAAPLCEGDAYPAMPEDGHGWEKLYSERLCRHFWEDFGVPTRVARLHNVYGPRVTWQGGREEVAAAICRKVAIAKLAGQHSIEVWGDGRQTRSFMYIDDCVRGINLITDHLTLSEPVNLGSSQLVSINQLVDVVEEIAGVRLERRYNLSAPQGVAGRSSDNARLRELTGWEPDTSLVWGMERTYRWIYDQLAARAPERSARLIA